VRQFNDPIIRILLVAAVISIITGVVGGHGYLEAIGILVAIFLATFMAFINEYKAGKEFDVLNQISDDQPYTVRREGRLVSISKKEITVGDVVLLEAGQEIPADGVVLSAVEFQVDESSLTGESIAVTKKAKTEEDGSSYPYFKLFKGSLIATGYGEIAVNSIGDTTEMGQTARQSSEETNNVSPLTKQLEGLSMMIGRVGISLSVLLLVIMIAKDYSMGLLGLHLSLTANLMNFIDIAMVSIALIVMSVPEGLPMSVTLSLAYSMRKMIKNHALVRRMEACETIGAVTVICTDKTGTLTLNQMKVAEL
jgi:Ca2+-transporting ATPase